MLLPAAFKGGIVPIKKELNEQERIDRRGGAIHRKEEQSSIPGEVGRGKSENGEGVS